MIGLLRGQEKDRLIAMLQEQIRKSDSRMLVTAPPCSWMAAPRSRTQPRPSSSGAACSSATGPPLKLNPDPAAAVPKTRSKPPKTPVPQTSAQGDAVRRTTILPALSRLNRAQLENLAIQWEVAPRGKTVAQIWDALYDLDKDMREGRRPAQSGER